MKKIVLITTVVLVALVVAVACKKDEGQDALQFKFEVTSKTETIETGLGTNDVVPLEFFVERQYVTGSEMTYSITSNRKNFTITNSKGEELTQNKSYKMSNDTLVINYKGLEQGIHTVQVLFKNDKGVSVEKRIDLTFANYDFNYSVTTEKKEIYQGEEVTYKLNIDSSDLNAGEYSIKFTSYEENDKNLDKSSVLFEGEKIEFDKWYKLKSLSDTKIDINSFYSGAKSLKGVIKNKNSERNFVLNQTIKNRVVTLGSSDVSKAMITSVGEKILYKAIVEKKPKQNNKIWYKTWATINAKAPEDGITTTKNEYVEYTLTDTGYFEIPIETKKGGEYQYNIIFKDEFGNESFMDTKNITVDNKDFNIHLRQDYNVNEAYQGQELVHLIRIEQLQNVTNENYDIRLLSFEDQDPSLSKSKILYRQNDVDINEDALRINQWKSLNSNDVEKGFFIVLNSFYTGTKKVKFEIKNSQVTKTYEFEISIKQIKYQITLNNKNLNKLYGGDSKVNLEATISRNVSLPNDKENKNHIVEYKIEEQTYLYYRWTDNYKLLDWKEENIKTLIKYDYDVRSVSLKNDEKFKKRRLLFQIKDRFGNVAEQYLEFDVFGITIDKAEILEIDMQKSAFLYGNKTVYQISLQNYKTEVKAHSTSDIQTVNITIGDQEPYGYDVLHTYKQYVKHVDIYKSITPTNPRKRSYDDFVKRFSNGFVPYNINITDKNGNSYLKTSSVKANIKQ